MYSYVWSCCQNVIRFVISVYCCLYLVNQWMNFMIVQRLKKTFYGDFQIAQRYYGLVSALNDINLTQKEIELMSFIALSGKEKFDRMEFCSSYNTTRATVNNMVAKLMKKNVLVKSKNAVMVNPLISLDFSKDVQLEIKLVHGEK